MFFDLKSNDSIIHDSEECLVFFILSINAILIFYAILLTREEKISKSTFFDTQF